MSSSQGNRWLIAIMGTVLQIALGTVYAWSFFQKPIMDAYSWSNMQVAWIFSLAICFLGIAAAIGGVLLPKMGPKKLAITGAILYPIGWLIGSYAMSIHSLVLLYIGFGVIGGLGLGLGYVTPVATSVKWFPDKKGFITGMVLMGFGLGALAMSKLIAPMMMNALDGDLVQVFTYIGILMFVLALPAAMLLKNPPAGYVPAGYTPPVVSAASQSASDSLTVKDALLSSKFMRMWLIFFLNISAGMAFIGFQSPLLQDLIKKGMDATTNFEDPAVVATLAAAGATLIGISSLLNGIGRFFWGGLSDKIGRIQAFRLILGTQIFCFISLIFVTNPWIFGIIVCYILLCYGGGFGTMPSFVSDVFSPRLMGVVYGVILTAWSMGGIVGPQIVAFLKDNFGKDAATYTFISGTGLLILGLLITFTLNNKSLAEEKK